MKNSKDGTLTILGSGGWIPTSDYHTACYAFKKDKILVLLDFGTGITRLLDDQKHLLDDVERIIGIISHYHADHISGLFYMPSFLTPYHLELYAPGEDLYSKPAEEMLGNIFSPPFSPRPLMESNPGMEIHDIPMGGITIDGIEFKFRAQLKHVHPSVAVRIGDHLTYCTDTEPEYETIHFAKGTNLLLHECWFAANIPTHTINSSQVEDGLGLSGREGHSSNLAVALIAREAGVRKAMTIHHNPTISKAEIQKMAQDVTEYTGVELFPAKDCINVHC